MTDLVSIEALGREIKVRIEAGDKAIDKAEQHYLAAGLQLLEAHKRLKESREMNWSAFLSSHVRISDDTARNYMAIARGETTLTAIRETARLRMAASRERKKEREAQRAAAPAQARESDNVIGLHQPQSAGPAGVSHAAAMGVLDMLMGQDEIEELRDRICELEEEVARLRQVNDDLEAQAMAQSTLSAAQENERIELCKQSYLPLGDYKTFLGWNRCDWAHAPDQIIAHFGLTKVVGAWRREWDEFLVSGSAAQMPKWDRGELYAIYEEKREASNRRYRALRSIGGRAETILSSSGTCGLRAAAEKDEKLAKQIDAALSKAGFPTWFGDEPPAFIRDGFKPAA